MQVIISLKKDNGEVIEIVKDIIDIDEHDVISSVEHQVLSIKDSFLPILSEKLIEHQQSEFKGKKNKEEKWE